MYNLNIRFAGSREHHKVFVILLCLLIIPATCFAQQDKSQADTPQYYSPGDEIILLNEAMKMRVTVEIVPVAHTDIVAVLGAKKDGIVTTITFENTGETSINWTIMTGPKHKDSEVVLLVDNKKEFAPVADKDANQTRGYLSYPRGAVGRMSTNMSEPGEKTKKLFLFAKPKKGTSACIVIRQLTSGVAGYEPIFPEQGIHVKFDLST